MSKCHCSSECQIKAIFFLHFTLFFLFLALNYNNEAGRSSELMYLFSGTFLLVALFAALCSKSRAHHLAHLAGLIDLAAILVDVLLFWPQVSNVEYLIKPYWIPFFLNLLLRLPFAILLLRISASGSAEKECSKKSCATSPVQLKNKKALLGEDDIESPNSGNGDKNNNLSSNSFSNRFSYSTDDGVNEPAKRLLLSNKSTEV